MSSRIRIGVIIGIPPMALPRSIALSLDRFLRSTTTILYRVPGTTNHVTRQDRIGPIEGTRTPGHHLYQSLDRESQPPGPIRRTKASDQVIHVHEDLGGPVGGSTKEELESRNLKSSFGSRRINAASREKGENSASPGDQQTHRRYGPRPV